MALTTNERAARSRAKKRGEKIEPLKRGPKKGYRQSQDHIAKRKRFGDQHPNWKGDAITEKSGRSRAIRAFPMIGRCVKCGASKAERHHKNGNTADNSPENIEIVCRRCHMKEDGRLAAFTASSIPNLALARAAIAANRKEKTHCPKGHPYEGSNLYVNVRGSKTCRKCLNDYKRSSRAALATARG